MSSFSDSIAVCRNSHLVNTASQHPNNLLISLKNAITSRLTHRNLHTPHRAIAKHIRQYSGLELARLGEKTARIDRQRARARAAGLLKWLRVLFRTRFLFTFVVRRPDIFVPALIYLRPPPKIPCFDAYSSASPLTCIASYVRQWIIAFSSGGIYNCTGKLKKKREIKY